MSSSKATNKCASKICILLPLCMVIFIDTFALTLVYPLFAPLFSLDTTSGGFFSSSVSMPSKNMFYGLSMAIYPIFMFFTAPFLGNLSDHIGRKKVLLLCLLGASIAACLSGIAVVIHSFILFFIARVIAGCVAGSLPVAQAAITDISDEQDKTINISLVGFAYTFGLVFGPVIGGFLSNKNLLSWFNLATPFFVTTLLSLGNATMLMSTFKETLAKTEQVISSTIILILKPLLMFVNATKNKATRNIILACFFYILGWNVYLSFISLHLFQQYQFSATEIGYFVSWVGLILSITMAVLIRVVTKYFNTIQTLQLAIMLSIMGIFINMIPYTIFQWLSAIPIACGMGLAYTAITKIFSDAVATDLQGWIMGVAASTMAAAAGVGGILTGFVSTNYLVAFISTIIIWILCLWFARRLYKLKA